MIKRDINKTEALFYLAGIGALVSSSGIAMMVYSGGESLSFSMGMGLMLLPIELLVYNFVLHVIHLGSE